MKDRVASLLKMDSKADILSSSSSKKNKDENVAGLFCGEKKLKIVLSEATKKSAILTKVVVPARKPGTSSYKESLHGPDSRPHSRSRTRSRSPDKNRDSGSRNTRFFRKKKSSNGGGTSKGSRDPKSKKQRPGTRMFSACCSSSQVWEKTY